VVSSLGQSLSFREGGDGRGGHQASGDDWSVSGMEACADDDHGRVVLGITRGGYSYCSTGDQARGLHPLRAVSGLRCAGGTILWSTSPQLVSRALGRITFPLDDSHPFVLYLFCKELYLLRYCSYPRSSLPCRHYVFQDIPAFLILVPPIQSFRAIQPLWLGKKTIHESFNYEWHES